MQKQSVHKMLFSRHFVVNSVLSEGVFLAEENGKVDVNLKTSSPSVRIKESLTDVLERVVLSFELQSASLSNRWKKSKGDTIYSKVTLRPIEIKGVQHYQFTYHYATRVIVKNYRLEQAKELVSDMMKDEFRQALLITSDTEFQVLVDRDGESHILRKILEPSRRIGSVLSHNRAKQYVLPEGRPVPFLISLGVMNSLGKVAAAKYSKFRQINRFLELIEDVMPHLEGLNRTRLRIVDFGCGKSYLTFALHHYLTVTRAMTVQIEGMDLKRDVIDQCNQLSTKLAIDSSLRFHVGDIADYEPLSEQDDSLNDRDECAVDLTVALHACDTATDLALSKAVRWGSEVILAVPCCQHEVNGQVEEKGPLQVLLQYGLLKERFSALTTDAARAQILDLIGYQTQVVEFIDMEHTVKNILIRAVKRQAPQEKSALHAKVKSYLALKHTLGIEPRLEVELKDLLEPLFQSVAQDL